MRRLITIAVKAGIQHATFVARMNSQVLEWASPPSGSAFVRVPLEKNANGALLLPLTQVTLLREKFDDPPDISRYLAMRGPPFFGQTVSVSV
jgi:hypothetical protein